MFVPKHKVEENIKTNHQRSWFDIVEDEERNRKVKTDMEENKDYIPLSDKIDKEKERDIKIDFFGK